MTVRVAPLVAVLSAVFFIVYPPILTAQTTTTTVTTVRNADETYTVIEYPSKKQVTVTLKPSARFPEATGRAKVLRTKEETLIDVYVAFGGQKTDLLDKNGAKYRGWQISKTEFKTCVDGTVILIEGGVVTKTNETCKGTTIAQETPEGIKVYAVDDRADVIALGAIEIDKNGVGERTFATPLTKFMLLVSPDPALTTYNETTPVLFKSVVPEGFAAIRLMATGEQVSAVWYPTGRGYSVPSLNIPGYKSGDDTKITVKFSKSFTGTRANVYITPRKDGPTEVRVRFHNLKEPPTGKRYVLWAVSADNQFTNLSELVTMNVGQIVRRPVRIDIDLKGQTTLSDFGLLLTMENSSLPLEGPAGPPVATFHIGP